MFVHVLGGFLFLETKGVGASTSTSTSILSRIHKSGYISRGLLDGHAHARRAGSSVLVVRIYRRRVRLCK